MAEHYDETTYGERIASIYDELYSAYDPAAIELLAELAQGGQTLELAIGTGRIAIPLQQRGVSVAGIDASEAMVARLRAKAEGADIPVTMGNFADVAIDGQFDLIYIVFNTFYALREQEEQVRCFANVAQHLKPDGRFLIEAFVPDLCRFDRGQRVSVVDLGGERVQLDAGQHDLAKQEVRSRHILISEDGIQLFPVHLRYVWPAEMDLMARLAGLVLAERWGGWQREPFTSASGSHVSVYRRAG
ncbi:MAG: class I SAM-dependent methyltransferase [Anaerolineae bacterium]|nr:class I SAM-dependent methyltransferase [Anaerolineae bacterium]